MFALLLHSLETPPPPAAFQRCVLLALPVQLTPCAVYSNNQVFKKDREGNVTWQVFDNSNRRTAIVYELTSTNLPPVQETIVIRYGFDRNGHMVSLTDDNGNVTGYTFDACNRMKRETLANGSFKEWFFDAAGLLVRTVDNNGTIVDNTYDQAGRLVQKDIQRAGTDTVANPPLQAGQVAAVVEGTTREVFSYDGAGHMTLAENYDGAHLISRVERKHNSLGQIVHETQTPVGPPGTNMTSQQAMKTLTSEYDLIGFRTRLTYPSGRFLSYTRDPLGRVETICGEWHFKRRQLSSHGTGKKQKRCIRINPATNKGRLNLA